jgi:Uma2 family endonuclease
VTDIDTYFGPDDVRRADIAFYSKARAHFLVDRCPKGPPDLAIEILSPSNKHVDRGDKFTLYRDCDVLFYWIFDPMLRTVEAFRLEAREYVPTVAAKDDAVVRIPPFEDLEIDLAKIWRPKSLS